MLAVPLISLAAAIGVVLVAAGPHHTGPASPHGSAPSRAAHARPGVTPQVAPGAAGGWASSVYLMPLDNNPPTAAAMAGIIRATGEKDFLLSFVLDSGGCTPAWDGNSAQSVTSDPTVAGVATAIRRAGGDVGVSFGGWNGTELAQTCRGPRSLAAAYQKVVTTYQVTHLDFSIEHTALGDTATELKRSRALAILQKKNPGLTVSLTTPVGTAGLSSRVTGEVQQAVKARTQVAVFNLMDFDYGLLSGTQAASDETAARTAASQLATMEHWPLATAWEHLGITLMNGHSDQPSELFSQATFASLLAFARSNHLARFSFWSLNRDQPCPAGQPMPWTSGNCSGVPQAPYDFTKIVARYRG
ncbi:MAG TPA: chitinase [Streptosporangiaceae bacterium]|nr:chitinase [Streptosporangiaceae bacterium]